ncbi:hypothetical protein A3841_16890 [Pontibacter flavimaris]|uniref:Uncharacterized protein n=1 Tax=Pontibacter flavimaris TaxID=1797110 RepID=A0A1Q5PCS3_9BACT|nr:hypothetical protein A3841_16890 [Pontibacter flavimaris]
MRNGSRLYLLPFFYVSLKYDFILWRIILYTALARLWCVRFPKALGQAASVYTLYLNLYFLSQVSIYSCSAGVNPPLTPLRRGITYSFAIFPSWERQGWVNRNLSFILAA